jgi:hypothetical protein
VVIDHNGRGIKSVIITINLIEWVNYVGCYRNIHPWGIPPFAIDPAIHLPVNFEEDS